MKTKKGLFALLLALLLCMGLSRPAFAEKARYSDVPEDHWAAEDVERAAELGLFYGVGGGEFGLGQPISRAAFATALVRLFDWETTAPGKASFSDVAPDAWYYAAIETACANGAVAGSDQTFRPDEDITRGEMAAMLVRGLGYTSLAGTASGYDSPFTDVTANKGFITLAYDMGIMNGLGDGLFNPDGTATREMAAVMLVRTSDRLNARSVRLAYAGNYDEVSVATPKANPEDQLPTTPLEPLAELYNTLRELKDAGTDMSHLALRLTAGGVRTVVADGAIVSSEAITARQVSEILAMDGVRTYYSDPYQCAYCIYRPAAGQEATVWYQSSEGTAAKLQMARLFGVTRYFVV